MTVSSQTYLVRLYRRYLDTENSADFIRTVASYYSLPTLHRIALGGDRVSRRAAMMAVCFIGGNESFETIGHGLRDDDRAVRLLAEDGSGNVWLRSASKGAQQSLQVVVRHICSQELESAIDLSTEVIEANPEYAEAFNQRAIAYFESEMIYDAIADCQRVLELNPYHFPAATGLGHCFMELGDLVSAIEHFQHALEICPDLEYVRSQIDMLQRSEGF
jgi:tetratricopeptide (TPR) repeat protein